MTHSASPDCAELERNRPSTNTFDAWWSSTRRFEGTLRDWEAQPLNRADRGGRTNFGITERTFRASARVAGVEPTSDAFENLSPRQAKAIGASMWKVSKADQLDDPGVALVVGDWFWGSNTHAWRRIKETLRAAGHSVPSGSELDAATIEALNSAPAGELITLLSEARRQHHLEIVVRDPSQAVFLKGWQRRTTERELMAVTLSCNPSGPLDASSHATAGCRLDVSGSQLTGASAPVTPRALQNADRGLLATEPAAEPGVVLSMKRRRSATTDAADPGAAVQAFAPSCVQC